MKRPIVVSILFGMSILVVLKIHEFAPTNMAGPGLDLPVWLLAVSISLVVLIKHVAISIRGRVTTVSGWVYIVGSLALLITTVYGFNRW